MTFYRPDPGERRGRREEGRQEVPSTLLTLPPISPISPGQEDARPNAITRAGRSSARSFPLPRGQEDTGLVHEPIAVEISSGVEGDRKLFVFHAQNGGPPKVLEEDRGRARAPEKGEHELSEAYRAVLARRLGIDLNAIAADGKAAGA